MSQININPSDSGDRSTAAGFNMVTALVVLVVVVLLAWLLLAGPFRGTFGGYTTPNRNPPAQQQPVPTAGSNYLPSPAQPSPMQPTPAKP
jgi:hypothetical protein